MEVARGSFSFLRPGIAEPVSMYTCTDTFQNRMQNDETADRSFGPAHFNLGKLAIMLQLEFHLRTPRAGVTQLLVTGQKESELTFLFSYKELVILLTKHGEA